MKNLYLFLCTIGLSIPFLAHAYPLNAHKKHPSPHVAFMDCPKGDFILRSQGQVDSFALKYATCDSILGSLSITDTSITDISALKFIKYISGSLWIYNTTKLKNLDGFSQLREIGGDVDINFNTALESISGLTHLKRIDGYRVRIYSNKVLVSLSGLDNITELNGDLLIYNNDNLRNLIGFPALKVIKGELEISNNDTLETLTGLNLLEKVEDKFFIISNKNLLNLSALSELKEISRFLSIYENPKLESLKGLEKIELIKELNISNNARLTDCSLVCGWYQTKKVQSLYIRDNPSVCSSVLEVTAVCDTSRCPKGDIELLSQNDVNTFAAKYANCDSLAGSLRIYGSDKITDLSGLKSLKSIKGNLTILGCQKLKNLDGLSNLRYLGGFLDISSNDSLQNIRGLSTLKTVGDYLSIAQNNALESLVGLGQIDSVKNELRISFCPKLQDLTGLPIIKRVNNVIINNNNTLQSLKGLDSLNSVTNYILISYNAQLTNITALKTLRNIGNQLSIEYNAKLNSLSGLDSLKSIGSYLSIRYNSSLSNCSAICSFLNNNSRGVSISISDNPSECSSRNEISILCSNSTCPVGSVSLESQVEVDAFVKKYSACDTIQGDLSIMGFSRIVDISGLKFIKYIKGDFTFGNNSRIKNLDAFSQLRGVEGELYIFNNDSLKTISGLSSLTKVGKKVRINSIALESLQGLQNITQINSGLEIFSCHKLKDVKGLPILKQINGLINIRYNDSLETLSGLDSLNIVRGYFIISDNKTLKNVTALSQLKQIHSFLDISYNNTITSLIGLENIDTIGGAFTISNNAKLSDCKILCRLLNSGKIRGTVSISNNPSECSSRTVITTACATTVCPIGNVTLATQAEVNAFVNAYNKCDSIPNNLTISGNTITSISGLSFIKKISGNLVITACGGLVSLTGLNNLTKVNSNITISANTALASLSSLEKIDFVGGSLSIFNNTNLTNCSAICALLSSNNIRSTVNITNNPSECSSRNQIITVCTPPSTCPTGNISLTSQIEVDAFVRQFSNCDSLVGNLSVSGSSIVDISGLKFIKKITGSLSIIDADKLKNLTGFSGLTYIGKDLNISFNDSLTTLLGLEKLTFVGQNLVIQQNRNLSECGGICQLISKGGVKGVSSIANNPAPCGSVTVIQTLCTYGSGITALTIKNLPPSVSEGNLLTFDIEVNGIVKDSVVVNILSSNETEAPVQTRAVILAGKNSLTISTRLPDDAIAEPNKEITISVGATALTADKKSFILTNDSDIPRITFDILADSLSESAGIYATKGSIKRANTEGLLTVRFRTSEPNSLNLPTQITFNAGQREGVFDIGVFDNALVDGFKNITLTAEVVLPSCNCAPATNTQGVVQKQVVIIDNDGPSLTLTVNPLSIQEGVTNGGNLTISRNTATTEALVVQLRSSDTTELVLPATVTIPQGERSVTIPISGKNDPIADGNQQVTLQANATGFAPGATWVIVTDINKPDLIISSISVPQTKIATSTGFQLRAIIANKGFSAMPSGSTLRAYLSKDKTIDDSDFLAGDFTIGQSIAINDSIAYANVANTSAQPGNYYLICKVNYNAQFTELLYLNNTSEPIAIDVLPDYVGTAIVDKTTFLPNETILVYGSSKKTDGRIVPNVVLEVYITNGEVRREFTVKTDSTGKYQLKFERLPDEAGHYTVGASFPKLNSKQVQDAFDILGVLVNNGRYLEWQVMLNDTLKGSVSVTNLSKITLNNITLKAQNLPAGAIIRFDTLPVLEGMQSATIKYTVLGTQVTATRNFHFISLMAESAEKTNQKVNAYYFCLAQKANLAANIASIKTSVSQNKSRIFEFKIFHQGQGETGEITVNIPKVDWLKLVSKQVVPSMTSSDTSLVIVEFIPTTNLPFNTPAKGTILINAKNSDPLSIPFTVEKVSTNKGGLIVDVVDNYTYFTAEAPHVKGAKVTISHYFTGQIYAEGITNEQGLFNADSLPEGTVRIRVQADKHEGYDGIAYVSPGLTNKEVVFIAYQAISFSWDVKPTTITDEYTIDLIMRFETNVPAPVVVMEMPDSLPQILGNDTYSFFVTMTNKGLITARDVQLQLPSDAEYEFVTLYSTSDLLAQQAIQVPVTMKRKGTSPNIIANDTNKIVAISRLLGIEPPSSPNGGTGGGEVTLCADFVISSFWFECGPEKRLQRTAKRVLYEKRACITVTIPDPPIGDPPPPRDPGIGGNGGWKWPEFEIPTINVNISCNTCLTSFGSVALNCGSLLPHTRILKLVKKGVDIVNCAVEQTAKSCLSTALDFGVPALQKSENLIIAYLEKKLPTGSKIPVKTAVKITTRVGLPVIKTLWDFYECGESIFNSAETCGWKKSKSSGLNPNGNLELRNDKNFPSILQEPLDNLVVSLDAFRAVREMEVIYYGALVNNENVHLFVKLVEPYLLEEKKINDDQRRHILAEMANYDISQADMNAFINKFNATFDARIAGVFAPNATFPNIIDNVKLDSLISIVQKATVYANEKGYSNIEEMGDKAYNDIVRLTQKQSDPNEPTALTPVCSSVSLNISQKLTMTREAFDGTLTVTNGNPDNPIQNLGLTIQILDENGILSNDLFQINTLSTKVLTTIDGTGVLAPSKSGTAVVRFIPTKEAAPHFPKTYSFGGYITYNDPYTGTKVTLPLIPVKLQVNPSPDLNMHYFMQRDILGDDALTPAIEPIIPAEFSVMIENNGYGAANNVVVESAQPKIIENEKGLAINFKLIGSNLQGQPAQMGVTNIPFGTIEAQKAKIGQWYFTSDLLGHFTQYETKLVHNNSFGNPNLSLISGVRLHELIRSVSVYGGADDKIDDFLVNDSPDVEDNPDAIYLSQGKVVYDVFKAQSARFVGDIQQPTYTNTFFMRPSILGWNYIKLDDPGRGNYQIISVVRSDGQVIPLKNVWLSPVTLTDTRAPIYEKKFHIVDDVKTQAEVSYTVTWKALDQNPPAIISITGQPTQVSSEQVKELIVKFNRPIDATTFSIEDLNLSLQGGENIINASVSISAIDSVTFRINLSNVTTGSGYFVFTVQAAAISDKNGSFGREGKQVTWTQFLSSTATVALTPLTEGALDPQHYTGITLTFNKKIRPLSIGVPSDSIGAVQLLKNGVLQSLSAATLTKIADNVYELKGFGSMTYPEAGYVFNIDMSKVLDTLGNSGIGTQELKWTVKRTTSLAINNLNITPDLGYSNADGITSTLQLTTAFTLTENAKDVIIYQNDNGLRRVLAVLGNKTAGTVSVSIDLNSGGNTLIEVTAKDNNNSEIVAQKALYIDETALSATWSLISNQILTKHPDTLVLRFSEKVSNTPVGTSEGVTDSVLQVTFNNNILSKAGLSLQRLSDSALILRGGHNLPKKSGTYTLGFDVRPFKKYSSGLAGNDIVFVSWTLEKPNQLPVADAGKDTLVTVPTQLFLDGSKSIDSDGDSLTYTWYPPTGIVLDNINSAKPSFAVTPALQDQTLSFILSVNDGNLSSTDVVNIRVKLNLTEPFSIVCNNQTIQLNESGIATLMVNDVVTITDVSKVDSVLLSQSLFNCTHLGANQVTVTATMNKSTVRHTCTATITVQDKIAPKAVCQDITVSVPNEGTITINPSLINNNSSDNCGIDSFILSKNTFDCTNIGENRVMLRVKDKSGNTSECSAKIIIEDRTAPTLVCKDLNLVITNLDTVFTLKSSDILTSSTDNCGIESLILSKTQWDYENIGQNTITIVAKDKAGNISQCASKVTIEDKSPSPCVFSSIYALGGQEQINVCVGDGKKDPAQLTNTLNRIKAYSYALTTADFKIIKVFTDANIDLETLPADGVWIWGFDYRGTIMAQAGESVFNAAFGSQCWRISKTAVKINRTTANAGTVQTADGKDSYFACQSDPYPDFIGFMNVNASNAPYVYLLTNESNKILEVITQGYFEFTNYPAGKYRVWGLSYTGRLGNIDGKNAATDVLSDGCSHVSKNFITIGVGSVQQSTVSIVGKNDYYFPIDDNTKAIVKLTYSPTNHTNYAYLMLNGSQNIIQIFKDSVINLANLPQGKYFIWGISYLGDISGSIGKNMWGGGIATGCYQMSATAITVDKYTPAALNQPLGNALNGNNNIQIQNRGELADNLDVVLHPNPMSDQLQIVINGNNEQPITLSLSDAFGRLVFQQKDAQSRMEINVSNFANGVYILTAKQGDKFVQRRVVKASGR